jgi:hypothetical protein
MKRVEVSEDGKKGEDRWATTGSDHYFHSLNYLNLASSQIESGEFMNFCPPVTFREAFVGRNAQKFAGI